MGSEGPAAAGLRRTSLAPSAEDWGLEERRMPDILLQTPTTCSELPMSVSNTTSQLLLAPDIPALEELIKR
jgi:hypothetical protein